MWWLLALLSAIFASLVTLFGKLGLKGIDSTLATTIRSVIMASSLLILSFSTKKISTSMISAISSKDWLLITLSGLAGATSWVCYFFALKYGLASKVSAIDRTSLLFIVILSAIFLGESFSWRTLLGAVFIISGTLLITLK